MMQEGAAGTEQAAETTSEAPVAALPQPVVDWLESYLPEPWMQALVVIGVAVVLGWALRFVLTAVVGTVTRKTQTDLDDKIVKILRGPVFLTVVLLGIEAAVRIVHFPVGLERGLVRTASTLVLLVWIGALFKLSHAVLQSIGRLADRVEWLDSRTMPLFENLARIVIVAGGAYGLLSIWQLDVAPWLASAGIVGIALGFAAKDTLANLFGGFFVIMDAPYKIGDYVVLDGGERGEVTKIGLRSSRILTRDDIEVTVPNAQIANAKIINESGGRWPKMRVRVTVGVAYGSEIDDVRRVLMEAAGAVDLIVGSPEPRVRFRELGDNALIFQLMGWISEPALRGQCIDKLLTEIYNRLRAEGIGIPFPQRELHLSAPIQVEGPQLR